MKCKNCGSEIEEDAKFCNNCGYKTEVPRICPNCGNEIKHGINFCGSCGAQLSEQTNVLLKINHQQDTARETGSTKQRVYLNKASQLLKASEIVKNLFANGADVTTVCNIINCDRKTFENWTLRIYGKQPKEVKKMFNGILQHKARTKVIKHSGRNANAAIFLARATGAMDDRVVADSDSSSNGGGSGGGIKAIVFGSAVELQKMGGIGIVDVTSDVTDVTPTKTKQIGNVKDPNKDCYSYNDGNDDEDIDNNDITKGEEDD